MVVRFQPTCVSRRVVAGLAVSAALLAAVAPLAAQDAGIRPPRAAAADSQLPQGHRTSHTLALPGRLLPFSAAPGAVQIERTDGAVLADVGYIAYTLDGVEPRSRPVLFAFNGGPGSSSVWLHLGALGPWRVPLTAETIAASSPPQLLDNAENWLDLADLVFIDPPGTGFSRVWASDPRAPPVTTWPPDRQQRGTRQKADSRAKASPDRQVGGPEWFWSLEGDVATFVEFIVAWLDRNGRRGSPVVLVGESYGGFRTPLIAEALVSSHRIQVAASILVSPVLDFDGRRGWRTPQHYVALLPSIAATRLERTGTTPSRTALAEAEAYAGGTYVADLMRGPRDLAAVQRMAGRISAFSGLSPEAVVQHAGRLTIGSFIEASPDLRGKGVSIYDAGMAGLDPAPRSGRRGGFSDPFTAGLDAPLEAAMAMVHARLAWRPERAYVVMSREVNRRWVWPNSPHPPQALAALHQLHRNDPRTRTLVTHGFTDLVTPYFASAIQLDQLPAHGSTQRIALEVYPGGHMFYSRDESRAQFRADAARLLRDVLGVRETAPVQQRPAGQRETP